MSGLRGHHEALDFGFDDESQVTPIVHFDFEPLDQLSDMEEYELEQERPKLLKRSQFLDRVDVLRAAAKSARGRCGRRGLAAAVVDQMYRDYLATGSLSKVGRLYGRTRQAMYDIFRRAGKSLNDRKFHARIAFAGQFWTPGKDGYYRPTTGDRNRRLHREIWKSRSGREIPAGWEVGFRNGDNTDFRYSNLICLPGRDVRLLHYWRRFPDRPRDPAALEEWWKKHYREYAAAKAAAFVARGLRSDGKPRRRAVLGRKAA